MDFFTLYFSKSSAAAPPRSTSSFFPISHPMTPTDTPLSDEICSCPQLAKSWAGSNSGLHWKQPACFQCSRWKGAQAHIPHLSHLSCSLAPSLGLGTSCNLLLEVPSDLLSSLQRRSFHCRKNLLSLILPNTFAHSCTPLTSGLPHSSLSTSKIHGHQFVSL